MAGRASVVLRDQFEVARRQGPIHGASTNLDEVREKVVLALSLVREGLQPIDAAAARHDVAWLAATYPDWVSERSLLRDEAQELKRLLDHLDQELDSGR
jgi:hypothetical protein